MQKLELKKLFQAVKIFKHIVSNKFFSPSIYNLYSHISRLFLIDQIMYQHGTITDKPKQMKFWVEEPLNLGIVGGKDLIYL